MLTVLPVIAPTFGLLLIGYLAARLHLLDDAVAAGLSDYVSVLAIPCLLARTILHADMLAAQPWGYWISYFGGVAVVWIVTAALARRVFGRSRRESVVFGFSAGHANTAMIGIPLILQAVGPDAATPLALLLAVHLPLMTVVATLLLEGSSGNGLRHAGRRILRTVTRNPIMLGIYAGLALRLSGLQAAGAVGPLIDPIAASAAPCALIGMGLAIARYGIGGELAPAAAIGVLKLVVHPAIVFVLARHVFAMPPAWSSVCVLFASCPTGINAYLLAAREGIGMPVASAALSLSTALAAVSISFWLLAVLP